MSISALVIGDFNSCAIADTLPISSTIHPILFLKLDKNIINHYIANVLYPRCSMSEVPISLVTNNLNKLYFLEIEAEC